MRKYPNTTKETLDRLYVKDAKKLSEIAKLLHISIGSVCNKLDKYGIPRRIKKDGQKRKKTIRKKPKPPCIWDVFDKEAKEKRRFDEKLRNARSA